MSATPAALPAEPGMRPVRRAASAENLLLATLTAEEREHLFSLLHPVALEDPRQIIYRAEDEIRCVYFPVTAVFSLASLLTDGYSTGVAIIAREGMSGIPALLGATSTPCETQVLVPGMAYRLRADVFRHEASLRPALRDLFLRYAQMFLDQITQTAVCRGHHTVRQRLASLLLRMRDGRAAEQLPVTQERLAETLGIGRPRVTLAAEGLQQDALIRYRRGSVLIAGADGLEAEACECYRLIRDKQVNLLREIGRAHV